MLPIYLFPRIELRRFKRIDFFPPRPSQAELAKQTDLCIASKSRTIGDPLVLSTLPRKLKLAFPHLRVTTYPRGFNPVVFANNPYVAGLSYAPNAVYGDDTNWGAGHLIQLKEAFFDLPLSPDPKPEIYLSEAEIEWASKQARSDKPICIIHPWGKTRDRILNADWWAKAVETWRERFTVWQVGIEGQVPIPGCQKHWLLPRAPRHARKLFSLMSRARAFVGVDSGPMHVARAFDVPSVILIDQGNADELFAKRREYVHYLHNNWRHSFLYESNRHFNVVGADLSRLEISVTGVLHEAMGRD